MDINNGWRIPADQLEQAVLQELSKFLEDGVQVVSAIYGSDAAPDRVQAAVMMATNVSNEIKKGPQIPTTSVWVRIAKKLGKIT